nr:hypothetical protein [Tanacetum cinerariifolium]
EPVVEHSTLNAPVAHSEWGTAGIGSSDDENEEQEIEEPLEEVEADPHTDVDESFFVDADAVEKASVVVEHLVQEENPDV